MDDFKMVVLFGGNGYEILNERIAAEIACLLLPAVARSTMKDSKEVLCRKGGE